MARLIRHNEREDGAPSNWEPFRLVSDLLRWDPLAEMFPSVNRDEVSFTPRFEVKETKGAYIFKADLPGIEEKDLDITLTGNRLTVSGRRESELRTEEDRYYAYERSYGSFSRSFTLPEGVNFEQCEAELKSGVLTLSIPKRPEHQPKKISLSGLTDKVKGVLGKDKAQT